MGVPPAFHLESTLTAWREAFNSYETFFPLRGIFTFPKKRSRAGIPARDSTY
jgi:hypothetical protein